MKHVEYNEIDETKRNTLNSKKFCDSRTCIWLIGRKCEWRWIKLIVYLGAQGQQDHFLTNWSWDSFPSKPIFQMLAKAEDVSSSVCGISRTNLDLYSQVVEMSTRLEILFQFWSDLFLAMAKVDSALSQMPYLPIGEKTRALLRPYCWSRWRLGYLRWSKYCLGVWASPKSFTVDPSGKMVIHEMKPPLAEFGKISIFGMVPKSPFGQPKAAMRLRN